MAQPGVPTPALSVTSLNVPSRLFRHSALRALPGAAAVATVGELVRKTSSQPSLS